MEYSATSIRKDFTHMRHLMRLADEAFKSGDLEELNVLAHEMVAMAANFLTFCEERGCAI